jgi:zinc protease
MVRIFPRVHLLGRAAVGVTSTVALAVAAAAQPPRLQELLRRDTLPNGLTVIVVENHAVPLATAHIVFRGGAATQTPDIQGVPHLFEHMLFRSYKSVDNGSFDDDASQTKASYNGATSDEEVSYTLWFPAEEIGGNVSLLAELVRNPVFRDKELQTERFVVRNEMQRGQSVPERLLGDASERALWGSWYPRKNTIGDDVSLFSATVPALTEFFQRWYVPNNAALIVTGDVSADKVFSEVRRHFGRWKRAPDPFAANAIPAPPALDSSFAFVYLHEVETVTVQVTWRGPTLTREPEAVGDAQTLARLLNADGSPFQRQLVDAGLFQSAHLAADINRHGSELQFTGTTTVDQITAALGMLGTVIGQLRFDGYHDATAFAADAKRQRVGAALAMQETSSLAEAIGSAWVAGRLDALAQGGTAASTSTPVSLAAFANRYLVGKPYVIGVLTPSGSEQQVGTSVAQFVAFMKDP